MTSSEEATPPGLVHVLALIVRRGRALRDQNPLEARDLAAGRNHSVPRPGGRGDSGARQS
jgi:hypothetical protein